MMTPRPPVGRQARAAPARRIEVSFRLCRRERASHRLSLPPRPQPTPRRRAARRTRFEARPFTRRRPGPGSTGFSRSRSSPMSPTHLATALVARFEDLRMTDVEAVGGKNASPRRNDQPAQPVRRARAGRLRDHGARLSRLPAARRPGPSASPSGWRRSIPKTCARWPQPAPRSAAGSIDSAVPARPRSRRSASSSNACRATIRKRASRCARRPPPKTCPMRRSPASRRPS